MEIRVANDARKKPRILIVDDQPLARAGLGAGLGSSPAVEVQGAVSSGSAAEARARTLNPDIILFDIQTSGTHGLTAMKRLMAAAPRARIIVLTALGDAPAVREFLSAGAWGYVLKYVDFKDILKAIAMVQSGAVIVSQGVPRSVFEEVAGPRKRLRDASALSAREKQLLAALCEGARNKDVARILRLSVRTVETHRYRIMRKLNIRSLAGLVRYAIAAGIARPD